MSQETEQRVQMTPEEAEKWINAPIPNLADDPEFRKAWLAAVEGIPPNEQ
jgi:hypothetical protein